MGSFALEDFLSSPFEVSLQELLALQKFVSQQRHVSPIAKQGTLFSRSKVRGRGMDYVETRNYFYGDDIRLMDWRVMARTHQPHVKVFEIEKERPILIFMDMSPSMFFGTQTCLKSVLGANLAGLLAWTAKKHGDRVGGMLSSLAQRNIWLPHAHNQSLINFLKALCEASSHYQEKKWNDWNSKNITAQFIRSLQELNQTLKPGTLVLLISDWNYPPEQVQSLLYEMRLHHDMILYHIADSIELEIPEKGIYPISNGKIIKNINLQTNSLASEYSEFCREKFRVWREIADKMRVPYYECSVQTDLSVLVRQSLLRSLRG
jgi:uncharacterized protein (DUF58 family)